MPDAHYNYDDVSINIARNLDRDFFLDGTNKISKAGRDDPLNDGEECVQSQVDCFVSCMLLIMRDV